MDFESKDPRDRTHTSDELNDDDTFVTEEEIEILMAEKQMLGGSTVDMGRRHFEENLPQAVLAIVKVARHSENDKLRFEAAKYIVERVLGKIQDTGTHEKQAWEQLLEDTTVVPGVTD
jgi:hypothetical protein